MRFPFELRPETALTQAERDLSALRKKHHQEWVKMFHEIVALKKELARNCEHDWDNSNNWCRKCGLDYEYYRQKGLWKYD
tara:strand:- start:6370 stop:6609 length:240 start_codon:yes stop_codon:yes gene_type:complete